jgi:hypothetical protein
VESIKGEDMPPSLGALRLGHGINKRREQFHDGPASRVKQGNSTKEGGY